MNKSGFANGGRFFSPTAVYCGSCGGSQYRLFARAQVRFTAPAAEPRRLQSNQSFSSRLSPPDVWFFRSATEVRPVSTCHFLITLCKLQVLCLIKSDITVMWRKHSVFLLALWSCVTPEGEIYTNVSKGEDATHALGFIWKVSECNALI